MARVFIALTIQSACVHVSHILNIQFCVFQCCLKKVSRERYCLTSHQVFISEPPPQPGGGASSVVRSQPDICLNYRRQVPQRWGDKMAGVSCRTCVPGFQYAWNVPGYLVPPVTPTRLQVCLSSALRWCHCTRITSLHQHLCPIRLPFGSYDLSLYSFVCLIPQCLDSNCTTQDSIYVVHYI